MVLLGRGRDKNHERDLLHSSRPSSSSLFSLQRKDSTGSLSPSVTGSTRSLHKKTSTNSLFSLHRLASKGSDASPHPRNLSRDHADPFSLEQARAPAKAAKVLGLDQPAPESFAQVWLRRGKNLKRHASKLSLTSSISTLEGRDEGSPGPAVTDSDSRSGSLDVNRSPNISPPSNFQHVTHTQPSHFRKFVHGQMSDNDLLAEFSALRAGQRSRGELRGIKAGDLHSRSGSLATSAATSALSSPRPKSPHDSAMSPLSGTFRNFTQSSMISPAGTLANDDDYQDADLNERQNLEYYHVNENVARPRQRTRPPPNFSRNSTAFTSNQSSAAADDEQNFIDAPAASHSPLDLQWEPSTSWSFPFEVILPPVTEDRSSAEGLHGSQLPTPRISAESVSTEDESRPRTAIDVSRFNVEPSSMTDAFAQSQTTTRLPSDERLAETSVDISTPLTPSSPSGQQQQAASTSFCAESRPSAIAPKPLAKTPKSILKNTTELDVHGRPKRPKWDEQGSKQNYSVAFAKENLSAQSVSKLSSSSIPKIKNGIVPPRHAKVQAELDQLQKLLSTLEAEAALRQESKMARPHTGDFTAIIGTAGFTLARASSDTSKHHRRQRTADATISHYAGSSKSPDRSAKRPAPPKLPSPILSSPGNPPQQLPPSPPLTPQQASSRDQRSRSRAGSVASARSADGITAPSKIPLPVVDHDRRNSSTASTSPFIYNLFPSPPPLRPMRF